MKIKKVEQEMSRSQTMFKEYGNKSMGESGYQSLFGKTKIKEDWEAHPFNDRDCYLRAPVVKHSYGRGDFAADRFMTRTFNRRMKARDTFTNILPLYVHEPKSCN